MKFHKKPGISFFSVYEREDGLITIEATPRQIRNASKTVFVVLKKGIEIDMLLKLSDAKSKYAK